MNHWVLIALPNVFAVAANRQLQEGGSMVLQLGPPEGGR